MAADETGVDAVVAQQFDVAGQILAAGLVPIIEPEVDIHSPQKAATEKLLKDVLLARLDRLAEGQDIMLKLTLPEQDGYHRELLEHPRVLRVAALSGGYTRAEAEARLAQEPGRDRQLLTSTHPGADRPDERRRVRRSLGRLDRGHLRGLVDLTIRCGPAMRRHRGHRWELGRTRRTSASSRLVTDR